MNSKERVKFFLSEALRKKELITEKKEKLAYGCVMVFLAVEKKVWNNILDQVKDEDLYRGEDSSNSEFGKEKNPHVTILYGIHKDVLDEDVEKLIAKINKSSIKLNKVSLFKHENFDVLKYDVESKDLTKYNKMFKSLPHTSTFPDYHPHVTICYAKKGKGDEYVKLFNKREIINIDSDKIVYSKPNSEEKTYTIK